MSYKSNNDEIGRVDRLIRENGTELQNKLNFCNTQLTISRETITKEVKERSRLELSLAEVMNNIELLDALYCKKDEL